MAAEPVLEVRGLSKRFADRIVPECGQNRVALELLPGSMRERNMRERI